MTDPTKLDNRKLLDRVLQMPMVKQQLDEEWRKQAEQRAATMAERDALDAAWLRHREGLDGEARRTEAEAEEAMKAAHAAAERAGAAQHASRWHYDQYSHRRDAINLRLAPLGQQAVEDARTVALWTIEEIRRIKPQIAGEQECVKADFMGRVVSFFRRCEATNLEQFEARAVAALNRINEIERKPLAMEDLTSELRDAVKEFTPAAIYDALYADRPDLRPSAEQLERVRAIHAEQRAHMKAIEDQERARWANTMARHRSYPSQFDA